LQYHAANVYSAAPTVWHAIELASTQLASYHNATDHKHVSRPAKHSSQHLQNQNIAH